MEEPSRSVRHRGVANAEQLKIAQRKFKFFDDAAVTEWKRLKELNQKRLLTPEHDACSHARWVHLSDLKNKKGWLPCYTKFYCFCLYLYSDYTVYTLVVLFSHTADLEKAARDKREESC